MKLLSHISINWILIECPNLILCKFSLVEVICEISQIFMSISYMKRLQFHMCKFHVWEIHMWKFHMWEGSNSICVIFMCKFHMWKGSNSICVNFICVNFICEKLHIHIYLYTMRLNGSWALTWLHWEFIRWFDWLFP